MSTRLHFVVEGQTEETFVNRVIIPHLASCSVWGDVRCVMTSRKRSVIHRGGLVSYARARKDILLWMKEDQHREVAFTTMFDLYALPCDFPGYRNAGEADSPYTRVAEIEGAMTRDMDHPRFVPYVQLHEFETLLLVSPRKLDCRFHDCDRAISNLAEMAARFDSPELIDDGPSTAPSKRIIREIPEYEGMKASAGPLIAERIGLPTLRGKCRHFDQWLSRLETLA
ncbi:MAG: DUF4276 family protein [Planctomycetes bacterium]|jgi:hypothetical protein|nr:DUF4276 family protein [Planctomycetota bacterium]